MAQISGQRETRLLLVTIAVSVGMLLLLARFRFPEQAERQPADPAPAPLERLAARATYDELAAIMADLERRVGPAVIVVPVQGERQELAYVPAVRFTPDRAIALLARDERVVENTSSGATTIIGRDAARGLVVLQVASSPGSAVIPRTGTARPGPRYIAVVEATPQGPAIRPVYVGRTDVFQDPRTGDTMLSVSAAQQTLARGSAVFSLDGLLIGLVTDGAGGLAVFPSDRLQAVVETALPATAARGDLGVEVQTLSSILSRVTGADAGVVVSYVDPAGPAAGLIASADVIQAVDETRVTTIGGFQQVAQSRAPGAAVRLSIMRAGDARAATVTARAAGARTGPVEETGAVFLTIEGGGTEVVTTNPGGPAARAGLQRGDLIVALNGQPFPTAAAIVRAHREAAAGQALLLTVQRGTQHRVVAMEKP